MEMAVAKRANNRQHCHAGRSFRNAAKAVCGWMAAVLLMAGLTACSSDEGDATEEASIGYDHSADVPMLGWSFSDTLFFPLTVLAEPELRSPIVIGADYSLWCSVRHDASYSYQQLPLTFVVQQTDTTGTLNGTSRVVRNMLRRQMTLPIRRPDGHPLGTSWGSLIQYETEADSLTLRFDSAGTYRMLLIPDVPASQPLKGVASVGLTLRRND